MPLIYKDFALNFRGLNHEMGAATVAVPGGRAYLCPDERTGVPTPYFDEIHFKMYDEPWWTHNKLRDRLAGRAAMQGRVYAGCAGLVNLEYIAATKAPAALLFDINPLQTLFWEELTNLIAAFPDAKELAAQLPDFTKALYYKIELLHGPDIVRDISPPVRKPEQYGYGSPQAPYRWMTYEDVGQWVKGQFGDHDGGRNWLANPKKYRHIHELCKNHAIAAVTLDIRDEVACARVAETLRTAQYEVDGVPHKGADVGLLYRSNVAYYLKWSARDIANRLEGYREWCERHPGESDPFDGAPTDYTKRLVGSNAYRPAYENLRAWFGAAGGHMIAADTTSGGGRIVSFQPRLRAVRGPAIVPP